MKLEEQVCSRDLAARLRALGVRQDSQFVWCQRWKNGKASNQWYVTRGMGTSDSLSAFSLAELGHIIATAKRKLNPPTPAGPNYLNQIFNADQWAKLLIDWLEQDLITLS